MNLRTKTLLSLSCALGILLVVVALLAGGLLLQAFGRVEDHAIADDVARVREALVGGMDDLALLASDWGPWDEVYAFAASKDEAFIENNLNDLSLENIRLNLIAFLDTKHKIVYGTGFDTENGTKQPLPDDLKDFFTPDSPLFEGPVAPPDKVHSARGLIVLREGVYLIAAHPILTSDFQGPSHGTLVFGRLLDEPAVDLITRRLRLPATPVLRTYAEFKEWAGEQPNLQRPLSHLANPGGMAVDKTEAALARSYFVLQDIRGEPAVVMEVSTQRGVWLIGRHTLVSVLAWTLLVGLVLGAVILVLLERSVLARLSHLMAGVTEVRRTGDFSRRLEITGGDQLSDLGTAINDMLSAVQLSSEQHGRAEAELAAEKERLIVTLRSIGDGVIATDVTGRVALLNRVAEELSGWTSDDAMGRPLVEVLQLIHENSRQSASSPVQRVLATGQTMNLAESLILVSRDGSERQIADSAAPIRDRAGAIIGAVLVFRDVTEQRKVEQERLRANKLESVGLLAGGIAHDFNNILTAILANISLAQLHAANNQELGEILTEAETASQRARDLTHQLLTFAKGGTPVRHTLHHLGKLVRETAGFAVRGSIVKCEFHVAKDLWPVDGDASQLGQVIDNIVINAVEAMPHGGTISVTAANEEVPPGRGSPPPGRYAMIAIADHGIGIPPEHLDRIFEPYFTTKKKGSGLGLASCYSIINQHNGHVLVDSELGVGSTFRIYLPAVRASAQVEDAARGPVHRGHGTVLVMDDEAGIRSVTDRMLRTMGYSPILTADGAEAVDCVRKAREGGAPIDAVIMDLTVPGGMGGKEAIRRIREIDPNIPAVVSSGYSQDPVMSNYRDYGFQHVIVKPYGLEQLGVVLSELLGR